MITKLEPVIWLLKLACVFRPTTVAACIENLPPTVGKLRALKWKPIKDRGLPYNVVHAV